MRPAFKHAFPDFKPSDGGETLDCCDAGPEPSWVIIKVDPSFDPRFVYTEPTKLMDIPPSLHTRTQIIMDINNILFLPHEKQPFNEGGGILAVQVELRVARIWSLLISPSYFNYVKIFQSMKKMRRRKCVQCLMTTLQRK